MEDVKELLKKIATKHPSPTPEEVVASELFIKRHNYSGPCAWDCKHCLGLGSIRNGDGTIRSCPSIQSVNLTDVAKFGLTPDEAVQLNWSSIYGASNRTLAVELVTGVLGKGYGIVTIYGTYGNGKTTILKTAVASALRDGKQAAYVSMSEILDDLRSGFDYTDRTQNETARLKWWSQVPILAIDELDRVRNTEYVQERQFNLLDSRYIGAIRQESITLISMNEDPSELPQYLYDRMRDGRFTIVKLDGGSVRPQMTEEK